MKNKTSACNLQVISHLPTSGKWAARHITLGEGEAMATSPVTHTRSHRLWGSLLLVDQNLLFFVCFLEARGGKAVMSSARAHLPKSCQDGTQPPSQRHGRFGGLLTQLVAQLYLRGGKVPAVGTLATVSLVSSGP